MTADVEQLHAIAQGLPNLNGSGDLPEVKVQFRTGEDVYEAAPETPDWLWHGYIAAGATTLFSGSQKSGKSTFLFALMRAFLDGHTRFVGHDVRPGRVILLTEEGDGTLRPKLEHITPTGRRDLRVLGRNDVAMNPLQWTQAVHAACIEALDTGARLVVIDTFAFWSKIQDENDTAGMQMAAAALAELTASDLGVVIVHHHGKNAEARENGNASRGSTSLPASVDIIVDLFRPEPFGNDEVPSNEREIRSIGRYPEIPEILRVALDGDGTYRAVMEGTKDEVRQASAEQRVTEWFMDDWAGTHSVADMSRDLGLSKGTVSKACKKLIDEGLVERIGEGNRARFRWVQK